MNEPNSSESASVGGRRIAAGRSLIVALLLGGGLVVGGSGWNVPADGRGIAGLSTAALAAQGTPAAPAPTVTLLYTINNLGYTDTCG